MSRLVARLLYWPPRILATCIVVPIILFALDDSEWCDTDFYIAGLGDQATHNTLVHLLHLLPVAIVAVGLILGWRREWIGTVTFTLLAAWSVWDELVAESPSWIMLVIPLFLLTIAGLFLANWIKRAELRAALHIGPAISPLSLREDSAPTVRP